MVPDAGSAQHAHRPEALLKWLEEIQRVWLSEPREEFDGRIPSAMIESERRRIPLVMSSKDMVIDEDCELCRMLGDEAGAFNGPGFWHLDGCSLDPGFEFSTYRTREEWEVEERRWREFTADFERKWSEEHSAGEEESEE